MGVDEYLRTLERRRPFNDEVRGWDEIACLIGVCVTTAQCLARDGRLPVFKVGGRVVMLWADFCAWAAHAYTNGLGQAQKHTGSGTGQGA